MKKVQLNNYGAFTLNHLIMLPFFISELPVFCWMITELPDGLNTFFFFFIKIRKLNKYIYRHIISLQVNRYMRINGNDDDDDN